MHLKQTVPIKTNIARQFNVEIRLVQRCRRWTNIMICVTIKVGLLVFSNSDKQTSHYNLKDYSSDHSGRVSDKRGLGCTITESSQDCVTVLLWNAPETVCSIELLSYPGVPNFESFSYIAVWSLLMYCQWDFLPDSEKMWIRHRLNSMKAVCRWNKKPTGTQCV